MFQLHGTGLHYKTHVGGRQGVLQKFPHIEEQIQVQVKLILTSFSSIHTLETNVFLAENLQLTKIQDILTNKESRMFIREHFCAFIRYLEELDPDLTNITSYMRKLDSFLFKILSVRFSDD